MSPDELVVTGVAVFVGPILWTVWLLQMSRVQELQPRRGGLTPIVSALAACALVILVVLRAGASYDVVGAPQYLFMYVVLGLAWVRATAGAFAYFGLSARDDVVERGNTAAIAAVVGALLGVTFSYAGGNVGDGPGWWVVLFSAALATGTLFVAWGFLTQLTAVGDAVVIDRDPAAGVRLGAFLVSCGLVLGRGVAGDWESARATVSDFLPALVPVAVILALAIVVERLARPTPQRPRAPLVAFGMLPSALYLLVAIYAASAMGRAR
jgi:hypothetical protein